MIPQFGERHYKLTGSRSSANPKEDKYDENRPICIIRQTTKGQR